jgi:hypothetical protein
MKAKKIFACGAIALLSATAPNLRAADAEVKADVDLPKTETRVKRDRDADLTVRTDVDRDHTKLRHWNKASGLLGMEVRNNDNQKLGEIKDLVMDSPGKVSYAVLAVGGFLGIGEKLIALPPSTLKVATDGDYLVLNADKAKIQAAPGFAATAWPSPHDPDIDRFWSDIKATGSPAGYEKDHRIKSEVDVETDSKHKIYTDADKDKKVKVEVKKD